MSISFIDCSIIILSYEMNQVNNTTMSDLDIASPNRPPTRKCCPRYGEFFIRLPFCIIAIAVFLSIVVLSPAILIYRYRGGCPQQ